MVEHLIDMQYFIAWSYDFLSSCMFLFCSFHMDQQLLDNYAIRHRPITQSAVYCAKKYNCCVSQTSLFIISL